MQRFKCRGCYGIVEHNPCPECGEDHLDKMCESDHPCTCIEDVHGGIIYCPTCGKPTCPCGSHDVVVVSRVTGYLSDVAGWNAAKRAELKERSRYAID